MKVVNATALGPSERRVVEHPADSQSPFAVPIVDVICEGF